DSAIHLVVIVRSPGDHCRRVAHNELSQCRETLKRTAGSLRGPDRLGRNSATTPNLLCDCVLCCRGMFRLDRGSKAPFDTAAGSPGCSAPLRVGVAAAVERALTVPLAGHHRALLCAADICASAPSPELAARLAPAYR